MNALGVIAFVVALLVSVMIHEAGHFLTARAFGMKATQFFVGFGPTLFSRRRGETEYGVKAVPAGGFVKIVGMTPLEDVAEADRPRAFYRQPTPQRVIVLGAGSGMHFVIALMLALGVAFFVPVAKPGAGISAVAPCVAVALPNDGSQVDTSAPCGPARGTVTAPAAAAGLRAGDVVLAVNGTGVGSDGDIGKLIRTSPTQDATLLVRRGTATRTLVVPLAHVRRDLATGGPGSAPAYAIGVAFGGDTGYVAPTWSQAWHTAGSYLGFGDQSVLFGTFTALSHVPSEAGKLFSPTRSQDTSGAQLSSVVGIARVSGEIAAAQGVPLSVRIGDLLLIIGAVNASVGILNLLPLLPFDGGHIAVTLAERWTRGRRRVGDAGQRIATFYQRGAPAMYAVSAVIILFSVLVLFADIRNPAA